MRVGFVTGEYPPLQGGIADYTQRLVRGLQEQDVEPFVLTSRRAASSEQDSLVLPVVDRWDWTVWRTVAQWARRWQWDVVHIQYQPAAYNLHAGINVVPWLLRRAVPQVRVVTTFHDLRVPYLFPKAGPLRQMMVRLLAAQSDGVIAVAPEDLALLNSWRSEGGVAHIPVGNNIDVPPPSGFDRNLWRSQLGATPETVVIAHLGFINRSKGVHVLIRALARLVARGLDVQVLMIGEQTGASDAENVRYLGEITALIERLRLRPHVHWTGFQPLPEVAAWLRCADIAALPYGDGASQRRTSLLACLAHGLPTVTVAAPPPPHRANARSAGGDGLVHGKTVWLIPSADAAALGDAIMELVGDRERRLALARGGGEYARRFAWPDIARRTRVIYDRTLTRAAAHGPG